MDKRPEPFTKKDTERYSTLYVNRELKIKTTMRYHYTPTKMAKIKNTANTEC